MTRLLKKFLNQFEQINQYYNFLVEKTKKLEYVGITNEWIIDNFYLLVEHKLNMIQQKKSINKRLHKNSNIYFCLKTIVGSHNYNIDFKTLSGELKKYQKETQKNFSYEELESIKSILVLIYTERLFFVCEEEHRKFSR